MSIIILSSSVYRVLIQKLLRKFLNSCLYASLRWQSPSGPNAEAILILLLLLLPLIILHLLFISWLVMTVVALSASTGGAAVAALRKDRRSSCVWRELVCASRWHTVWYTPSQLVIPCFIWLTDSQQRCWVFSLGYHTNGVLDIFTFGFCPCLQEKIIS